MRNILENKCEFSIFSSLRFPPLASCFTSRNEIALCLCATLFLFLNFPPLGTLFLSNTVSGDMKRSLRQTPIGSHHQNLFHQELQSCSSVQIPEVYFPFRKTVECTLVRRHCMPCSSFIPSRHSALILHRTNTIRPCLCTLFFFLETLSRCGATCM